MVPPVIPAPTMVTFARILLPTSHFPQLLDDGVGDLGGASGGWVVGGGLHVVGDAFAFGDDGGHGVFEALSGVRLVDVAEHHHAGEHHRHGVDLVHAGVLGRAA